MRKILLAVLVGTIFSHAQNLCVQLCLECSTDNSNAMCSQINETCGNCVAILDSIHQHEDSLAQARIQDSLATIAREDSLAKEKMRQDSLQKIDARKFGEIIHNNCKNDTCIYDVTVENRLLKHIKAKKENKNAGTWMVNKDTVTNRLPPMNAECSGFCSNCEENASNALCGKIEEQCRCTEYREEARRLQEKATVDSLAAIQSFLMKMQQAQKTSSRIFEYCEKKSKTPTCSLQVKLTGENLALVNLLDYNAKLTKDTAHVDTLSAKRDSTKKEGAQKIAGTSADSISKPQKKEYMGISLAYEEFVEKEVAGYSAYEIDDENFGINLGFFMRFYFYSAGSFQVGVNAVYHYGEYDISDDLYVPLAGYPDNAELTYHSLMFEIPVQGRFGFKIPRIPVVPFVSASLHVRKPIYAWTEYDVDYHWDSYFYGWYYDWNSYDGFYNFADWEFLLYVGCGVEIYRHISLQWQFSPLSLVTYSDELMNYDQDDLDTWRLSLDYAW